MPRGRVTVQCVKLRVILGFFFPTAVLNYNTSALECQTFAMLLYLCISAQGKKKRIFDSGLKVWPRTQAAPPQPWNLFSCLFALKLTSVYCTTCIICMLTGSASRLSLTLTFSLGYLPHRQDFLSLLPQLLALFDLDFLCFAVDQRWQVLKDEGVSKVMLLMLACAWERRWEWARGRERLQVWTYRESRSVGFVS